MTKCIRIALLATFAATSLTCAEDYRKWTEEKTKRKIEARIRDKKMDNSGVQLVLRSGKTIWIEASRLIEADRKVIKNWVKPVDHLECRIVGKSRSGKRIKVTARAGAKSLKVYAYEYPGDTSPVKKYLKAGKETTFEYEATDKYVVKAWSDGKLVDEEAWNRKTGL